MGGLACCRGGGGGLSLVVLVSEKPNLVSEKSGKSQGILFICDAGNPDVSYYDNVVFSIVIFVKYLCFRFRFVCFCE